MYDNNNNKSSKMGERGKATTVLLAAWPEPGSACHLHHPELESMRASEFTLTRQEEMVSN